MRELFPVHNKYTPEDWQWLLAAAGLAIRHQGRLRASHHIFVTTPAGPSEMSAGAGVDHL